LHNLGLIYYETENYEKAETAFEQAIKLEDDMASRYIAYAKVQEKLGNLSKVIASLERAVELEASRESLSLLYQAYITAGRDEDAKKLERRLHRQQTAKTVPTKVSRPRRIVA
jgi:tetratricopeptide (TPR) repeat protein